MTPAPPRGFDQELDRFQEAGDWVGRCAYLDRGRNSRGKRYRALLLWALTEDPHEFVRRKAGELLGERRERAGFDRLVRALRSDPKPYNRLVAARSLARLGDPEAVSPLLEVITDPANTGSPLEGALQALGELGDHRATAPILDLLHRTTNGTIRFCCLEALGALADPAANPTLLEYARTRRGRTDYPGVAIRAVAAAGDPASLLDVLDCWRRAGEQDVVAAAAALGTTETLAPLLETRKGKVRAMVATALGRRGDGSAIPALVAALERTRAASFRRVLIEALDRLGWSGGDDDPELAVLRAIEARRWDELVAMGAAAAPVIVRAYPAADRYRKPKLLECLGDIGDPVAIDLCRRAARASATEVRNAAAEALGALGDRDSVPHLVAALDEVLARKTYRWPAGAGEVRALGELADPRAEGSLVQALSEGPGSHRDALRINAADALGFLRTTGARAALVETLSDRDRSLRRRALRALRGGAWTPETPEQVAAALLAGREWDRVANLGEAEFLALLDRFPGEARVDQKALAPALASTRDGRVAGPLLDWLFRPTLALFTKEDRQHWTRALEPLLGPWAADVVAASSVLGRTEEAEGSRTVTYQHDLDEALEATTRLAAASSPLASHLLHRVTRKTSISVVTWDSEEWGGGTEDFDFAPQRARAAAALETRGDPPWDPGVAGDPAAWARAPGT
jgi:HEAT repeat protein